MRVVAGAALASGWLAAGSTALAGAPPVRVVEAEGMHAVNGGVIRVGDSRVLALRPKGVARAQLRTPQIASVVVRTRLRDCRRGRLLLSVNGGPAKPVKPRRRWADHRIELAVPAGTHTVRIRFRGGKRCRALLDRLELRLAPAAAPAPAATTPGPGAPQPVRAVPLGASVIVDKLFADGRYEEALRREFVSVTPENELKMDWIHPERDRWEFGAADKLVEYAAKRGIAVRGHTLIFTKQIPPWVGRLLLPGDAEAELRRHIHTVMARYKHHIRVWDVVNEAFEEDGSWRPNPWLDKLGPRYVELAFQFAREADPTATLVYNEFNAETNNRRRAATANLVRKLREKGLLDGVGLQLHTELAKGPTQAELEETMRIYEQMGLQVEVTEMDVIARGDGSAETLAGRLIDQATVYRNAALACAVVTACKRFTVWGVSDRYSWQGLEEMPLLLDAEFRAKPAMTAVREVLGG